MTRAYLHYKLLALLFRLFYKTGPYSVFRELCFKLGEIEFQLFPEDCDIYGNLGYPVEELVF